jgi:hypothetical protein
MRNGKGAGARGLVWRGTTDPCLKCNSPCIAVHIWYPLQHQLPIPSTLSLSDQESSHDIFLLYQYKVSAACFQSTKMSNKRNKGDDAPQTPLPRQSGRHNPNTPVLYSESQRKSLSSAVATATTPLIHNASMALTSSPVKDQRQLKTIEESRVSSAVSPDDVVGLKYPTSDSEIEAGSMIP